MSVRESELRIDSISKAVRNVCRRSMVVVVQCRCSEFSLGWCGGGGIYANGLYNINGGV